MSTRNHFGTDGVRGVANTELSPELAMALGAAAAHVLRENNTNAREIVVGRDPRLSGDLLEAALIAGICSQGVNVLSVGVLPTPGVAFVTQARGAAAGVVISASHNPMADNGIKFFGGNGKKLADTTEARIEALLGEWHEWTRPTGADVGAVTRSAKPVADYVAHLQSTCPVRLDGMKLVIDGANGAASFLAAQVFGGLGASVETIFCDPDGSNINDNCGSLHPEAMLARVRETGADVGLALDGDADRVILCDDTGAIFDGDRVLCLLGTFLHERGELANNVVIGTIMSNMGLGIALEKCGVRFVAAPVGDRYVAEAMEKEGAILGGEKSGHFLMPRLSPTGDGMLSALQVLAACAVSGRTLSDWAGDMTEYPQKLVSIPVRTKNGWADVPEIAAAIAAGESKLAGVGRLNVRPSGTEKRIRVMAEGPDAVVVDSVVESVSDAIRQTLGE
ncbi:MAG: phosphoglucosamine mutase [Armatimonadetes bacterium]|nr:phosphoglucosamine mutase [Armatimonadota bacterium]